MYSRARNSIICTHWCQNCVTFLSLPFPGPPQWAEAEVYPELGGAPRVPSQNGSQDTNQTTRGVRKNFSPSRFAKRRSAFFDPS